LGIRLKGDLAYSGSFEVQKAGPLDARAISDTQADLLVPANWEALDMIQYLYKGMIVAVHSDNDSGNNGLYMLIDPANYTNINAWLFIRLNEVGSSENIYITDFVIGGGTTSVQVQHNLNSRDLHVSTFLLPNYEQVLLDVEIDSLNTITFSGLGDTQTVHCIIGQGGASAGSNPFNAISITHNDGENLIQSLSLIPGTYYKITDYQTIHDAGYDTSWNTVIYTSPVIEPLIIQATTTSTFAKKAISETYPTEEIQYDFTMSAVTQDGSGGWDDSSGDWGDVITISSVQSTSFVIDEKLLYGDSFYIYIEDGTYAYTYHKSDLDTKFTVTDNGGGLYTIDFIDTSNDPINLTSGDGYIEIESDIELAPRPGYIIYRKDFERNIETNFDFRAVHRWKYPADLSAIPTWNSGTTYNQNDLVHHTDDIIYKCMPPNSTNDTPSEYNRVWTPIINKKATARVFSQGSTDIAGINMPIDSSKGMFISVLGQFDHTTETDVFTLQPFKNVSIFSEETTLDGHGGNSFENVIVESGCKNITLNGSISGLKILTGSETVLTSYDNIIRNNSIFGRFLQVSFFGLVEENNFYSLERSSFSHLQRNTIYSGCVRLSINNMGGSTIGSSCNNLRLGFVAGSNIDTFSRNSYFRQMSGNSIKYGMNYVYSYTDNFNKNNMGKNFRYTTIQSGVYFEENTTGANFGGSTEARRWTVSFGFQKNKTGADCFTYGTTYASNYINNCIFGDNVHSLTATDLGSNTYGNGCDNISTTASTYFVTYKEGCRLITGDNQFFCTFGKGCNTIDTTGGIFQSTDVADRVGGWTLGTGTFANVCRGSVTTNILNASGVGIVCTYIDGSGLQIGDPQV